MAPTSGVRSVDPLRLAELTLAAAVRANADAVLVEPIAGDDNAYEISFERARKIVANVAVDAPTGTATIARLAYLSDLDLVADHATHAIVPVKSGDREADIAITIRPGSALRAELAVLPRRRGPVVVKPAAQGKPGDVVGNYRLIEKLGEGGMGTVFRVEHIALGRTYALKQLRGRVFRREPNAAERFLREARAASRVRHPNIVDVFDFGYLADGRPYFVMELIAGESLAEHVERVGALPPPEVVAIVRQIANALAVVHDRGVIHADVAPGNAILVDRDPNQVKLVDFGLSAIVGEDIQSEDPEVVHGTPQYISPEQLRGLPATDRSDQYSLGAVMFKLLTGRPPFEHDELTEMCMMHLHAPVPAVDSPHGPLPAKLADIVTTCLQKSPGARFPGMRALLAALDDVERVAERRGWRKWLGS